MEEKTKMIPAIRRSPKLSVMSACDEHLVRSIPFVIGVFDNLISDVERTFNWKSVFGTTKYKRIGVQIPPDICSIYDTYVRSNTKNFIWLRQYLYAAFEEYTHRFKEKSPLEELVLEHGQLIEYLDKKLPGFYELRDRGRITSAPLPLALPDCKPWVPPAFLVSQDGKTQLVRSQHVALLPSTPNVTKSWQNYYGHVLYQENISGSHIFTFTNREKPVDVRQNFDPSAVFFFRGS